MRDVFPLLLWFGAAIAVIVLTANTITGLRTVEPDIAIHSDVRAP